MSPNSAHFGVLLHAALFVGAFVGDTLGDMDGDALGETLGLKLGDQEGDTVGDVLGELLGDDVGLIVSHTFASLHSKSSIQSSLSWHCPSPALQGQNHWQLSA